MTLGTVASSRSSAPGCFCSCCGAKMVPYFSEDAVVSQNQINQIISENFLTVKGAALFLPRGNGSPASSVPRMAQRRNKHTGDLQQHLQTMFTLLRPEDTIRLAVRLESASPQCTRYMVVVSTNGRQDTEESLVLGMDFKTSDRVCTVGLVLPLWSDTLIHLDGDGGFSVSTVNRVHVFKPVSVQAMWAALQSLHKACEVARCHNYYPGSLFLTWVSYYQSRVASDQVCINEWNAMQDVQSHRADSPVLFTDVPTERERTERLIKMRLREIMMQMDLENVTSKQIRTELEMQMTCNLREFKEFIDNEMIVILGQMDSPTEIFDHVFLGSEWNASNLEELQNSGVRYILNVTREIDNFFPGLFEYHNIRVYDEEATNLLEYWNDTYKFISKAKKAGAKCLVHCKMGVSRSASTVIAYAMKEYGWDLERAFDYVKERRAVTKPNPSFMRQLEEYQGILLASKQRHNKLWRSHSDGDLSEPSLGKGGSLDRGVDPLHNNNNGPASLQHFLGMAVLQALSGDPTATQHTAPARQRGDGKEEDEEEEETDDDDEEGTRDEETRSPSPPTSNGLCDSEEHLPTSSSTSVSTSTSSSHPTRRSSEDPPFLLPPLPRPRAATVVPKARPDVVVSSEAVPVPAARPHPPPSLHVLPPTPSPELLRAASPTPAPAPEHHFPRTPSPDPTEQSLDQVDAGGSVSESSSAVQLSYQQQEQLQHHQHHQQHQAQETRVADSLQLSLDTLSEGGGGGLLTPGPMTSTPSTDTPMAVSPLSPPSSSCGSVSALSLSLALDPPQHTEEGDDNNNKTATQPQQTGSYTTAAEEEASLLVGSLPDASTLSTSSGSSARSTDSIDFFSAREKFVGLSHSQDGNGSTSTGTSSVVAPRQEPSGSPRVARSNCPSLVQELPPQAQVQEQERQNQSQNQGQASGQEEPCPAAAAVTEDGHTKLEDGCSPVPEPQPDNNVSVRHMVTELESISTHPHLHLPLQQQLQQQPPPPPRSPLHLHLHPHPPETTSAPELLSLSTPSPTHEHSSSPTTPTRSWSSGSVRRARKQLEQRLKQGETTDCPVPACAPPASPVVVSANPSTTTTTTTTPVPSGSAQQPSVKDCGQPTVPSSSSSSSSSSSQPSGTVEVCSISAGEQRVCVETKEKAKDFVELSEPSLASPCSALALSSSCPESEVQSPPPPPPLPTPPTQETGTQPGLLWLEGVTEMETDTDSPNPSAPAPAPPPHPRPEQALTSAPPAPPLYSRLARSSEDLEKIQETLRELQAFLYEAGGAAATRCPDDQPSGHHQRTRQGGEEEVKEEKADDKEEEEEEGSCCGVYRSRTPQEVLASEPRGSAAVWQRAMEIEARIRQAGLTPPSLMKRSASLAKLDCLELSTHDLSSWDFHAAQSAPPPSSSTTSSSARTSDGPAATSSDCTQQQQSSSRAQSLSLSLAHHPVPDEAYKKQRVLHHHHQSPLEGHGPPALCLGLKEEGRTAAAVAGSRDSGTSSAGTGTGTGPAPTPPPSPPPPSCPAQHRPKGRQSGQDHAHVHAHPHVQLTSQHGKAHPLRRLRKAADKKRTVTVLYNTM